MLKSLLVSVVVFAAYTAAMFEGTFRDLDGAINSIDHIPQTQNKAYSEINNAFQNSGSYGQVMGGKFATGNVVYSGPEGEHVQSSGSYAQGKVQHFKNGRPFVTYGGRAVGYRAPICLIPVELSAPFHLKEDSYGYPKRYIYQELYNRPQVRAAILGLKPGQILHYPIKPHVRSLSKVDVSPVATGLGGCRQRKLSLRRFYAYGGQCWLINPTYQSISYVSCKHGCGYDVGDGSRSYCAGNHVTKYVWAYCEGLRYGARIQAVAVPLPKSCSCQTYQCK
ncbi:uncharacterized protein LOC121376452 isoform X2 [Gigantopelta aegis]|uniref:uncharacterized protein LOC121376452 isoform X2 n=1 Tax=Gigantopelta aegis TaxID=1735272 RepID=UPI001B88CDBB|nr:uncharacterized protein LOC121376452 isoform X2 [Gigantopelta aegis]